jgi:hypothetical protein
MNLKKLSLGLALAGLGVITLIPKAEAFQFRYLNQAPNPEGGFDFNFELKADSSYYYGNYIYSGETLTVRGFQGISNAALTAPQTNQPGMISADAIFDPDQTLWNKARAEFTTDASFYPNQNRSFSLQTFTITATSVPSGFVNANFGWRSFDPTPVPEPLTILGTLAALGFGSRCQKEFAKKQSTNSEEA